MFASLELREIGAAAHKRAGGAGAAAAQEEEEEEGRWAYEEAMASAAALAREGLDLLRRLRDLTGDPDDGGGFGGGFVRSIEAADGDGDGAAAGPAGAPPGGGAAGGAAAAGGGGVDRGAARRIVSCASWPTVERFLTLWWCHRPALSLIGQEPVERCLERTTTQLDECININPAREVVRVYP